MTVFLFPVFLVFLISLFCFSCLVLNSSFLLLTFPDTSFALVPASRLLSGRSSINSSAGTV